MLKCTPVLNLESDMLKSVGCQEERIKELLITFGQLKFYALQKDEEGKSAGTLEPLGTSWNLLEPLERMRQSNGEVHWSKLHDKAVT